LGDDCASLGFFPSYFKSVYLTTVGISIIGGQSQFYGHRNLKVIPGQRWRRFKVEIWYALYWNSECNFVGWPRGALRTTIYIGTYIENSDFFLFFFFFLQLITARLRSRQSLFRGGSRINSSYIVAHEQYAHSSFDRFEIQVVR